MTARDSIDAIIFGSPGTISETSLIHLAAFNQTFAELGLEWDWSEETFQSLLNEPGDAHRLLAFAQSKGDRSITDTTAWELQGHKTKVYAQLVRESRPALRPGVLRLLQAARAVGIRVGCATSSAVGDLEANFDATDGELGFGSFDAVTTIEDLDRGKPAPDAHVICMTKMGANPSRSIAIEDTEANVASAFIAGATVIATPGDLADLSVLAGREAVDR